jgi:hypothetical protein
MIVLHFVLSGLQLATPTPTLNPDSVTPTWVGFTATFFVAAVTVLLMFDLTRRVRRARYRGEIREKLEAERLSEEAERIANGEDESGR